MKKLIGSIWISLFAAVFLFITTGQALAATINYNNVISDVVFDNANSMNASQIDSFLNTFPNSCISTNNGFSAPDPIGYNPTSKYTYGSNVSAGTVIYHAAQAYGINPQVLLTTLQKEQGLVVGDGSNIVRNGARPGDCGALAISASVGYNCPDSLKLTSYSGFTLYAWHGTPVTSVSKTCVENSSYVGFSRQVINAAWLLTFDRHRSEGQKSWYINKTSWDNSDDLGFCYSGPMTQGTFAVCPSGSAAYYDGYITIDGTAVHMDNGATAALYHYTPHKHGQQLFFDTFTGWFGTTQATDLVRTMNDATVYFISGANKYPINSLNTLDNFSTFGPVTYVSSSFLSSYTTGITVGKTISNQGTVYFVSSGIKLAFTSCGQLTDYGLACGQEVPVTDTQILQFASGPNMTPYYTTTTGKQYYIKSGQRREILNSASKTSLGVSGGTNVLTDGGIDYLPLGLPVANTDSVINSSDGNQYLYTVNKLFTLPSDYRSSSLVANQASGSLQAGSIQALGITPTAFNGFVKDATSGAYYLVTSNAKLALNDITNWSSTPTTVSSVVLGKVSTAASGVNNGLIKTVDHGTVYFVNNKSKHPISSWSDVSLLVASPIQITTIPNSAVSSISTGPIVFGPTALVKKANDGNIKFVDGLFQGRSIATFAVVSDFGLPTSFRTVGASDYDAISEKGVLGTRFSCSGSYYVATLGKVYSVSTQNMTDYGWSTTQFSPLDSMTCQVVLDRTTNTNLPNFVRTPDGTIYYVQSGTKQPIASYSKYLTLGGTVNNTIPISGILASYVADGAILR